MTSRKLQKPIPVVAACAPEAGSRPRAEPLPVRARAGLGYAVLCGGGVGAGRVPPAGVLRAAGEMLGARVEETAVALVTVDLAGTPEAGREPGLRRVVAELERDGWLVRAGLAGTPAVAAVAARHGAERVTVVADGGAFLAPLPLAVLEPEAELTNVLEGWGIRTLGELAALPKRELASRLGAAGVALWEAARGKAERPLVVTAPPPDWCESCELEDPVETLEPLLFCLRRMLATLSWRLRAAHLAAWEITLLLRLDGGEPLEWAFRVPEPTAEIAPLENLLQAHLATVRTAQPVIGLVVTLVPGRQEQRQAGLFETGLRNPARFTATLAQVAGIVGGERVGSPQREDTHRPDAFVLARPEAAEATAAETEALRLRALHPLRGPALRCWRPPLAAQVETGAAGVPVRVWAGGNGGPVLAARGPYRLSGAWWESARAWKREEWDVELAAGLWRMVRDPAGWWLEGEYD